MNTHTEWWLRQAQLDTSVAINYLDTFQFAKARTELTILSRALGKALEFEVNSEKEGAD